MRIERVVADASPLIILFKSNLAGLLPQLFSEIIVPTPVQREVMAGSPGDPSVTGLTAARWVTFEQELPIPPLIAAWDLGVGESSVLAHALELQDTRVLLDDRSGRNCAKALNIRCLGTLSVILLAKRRGLIDAVAPAIAQISAAGCWLGDDVIQTVLAEAGEK